MSWYLHRDGGFFRYDEHGDGQLDVVRYVRLGLGLLSRKRTGETPQSGAREAPDQTVANVPSLVGSSLGDDIPGAGGSAKTQTRKRIHQKTTTSVQEPPAPLHVRVGVGLVNLLTWVNFRRAGAFSVSGDLLV